MSLEFSSAYKHTYYVLHVVRFVVHKTKPDADALRTEEAFKKSNLKPNITMAMQIAMMGIRALFSPVTNSQLSGLPYLLMFSFECSQLLFNFSFISCLLAERERP